MQAEARGSERQGWCPPHPAGQNSHSAARSRSQKGLMSVDEGTAFLQSLPLPANFKTMARALFRPLTQEVVNEVLDNNVSPGDDGVGVQEWSEQLP